MANQKKWQFKVEGMDCAEEVSILKRELGPLLGGVDGLSFDILTAKMTVITTLEKITPESICKTIAQTGMGAEFLPEQLVHLPTISPENEAKALPNLWKAQGKTIFTVASGAFTASGFLIHGLIAGWSQPLMGGEGMGVVPNIPVPTLVLYILAILTGSWFVLPKAWFAAKRLQPDINLLMTIAVLGAAALGDWLEAASVAFLFALSLALESWSVGRARRAVAALMDLTPQTVRLQTPEGGEKMVPPEQVQIGSRFLVSPGERFPLDGRVVQGSSEVNQAPITGESNPVPKSSGMEVFAGTVNGDGALVVESTKIASNTTLAHIIRMVGDAQSRRAPSEQWVEKFARIYTPAVMALTFAVMLIPPILLGGSFGEWFYRSLVLMVISCPCALVISTPVSIVAALAASARNGVLIKGGLFVELPAKLQAIAMDKTGTVTEGKPTVLEIVPLNDHTETELLQRACALEFHSTHPIARGILGFAREKGVEIRPADGLTIIKGKGATGLFNGTEYWLGSPRFVEERGQETEEFHKLLLAQSEMGRTVVVVGNQRHICGFLALADTIRPGAAKVLNSLRDVGVKKIVMLTGDNRKTAESIASEAGFDEVQSDLLPEDKVKAIEALVCEYGDVGMVGDGVNDAPAMGRSTVGIAMGAAGSDAAIETADIALMSDDLSKLPWLIRHSRHTLAIIRQNIYFSLSIKALFVVLTLTGHSSLWAAIAADMGTSLAVIFNGLRLLGGTGKS